jgi:hypothetical protein
MNAWVSVQEIEVDGVFAGVVVEEQLLLRTGLGDEQAWLAAAMALLAIEIHAGARPGPYSQRRARAFADSRAARYRARSQRQRRR